MKLEDNKYLSAGMDPKWLLGHCIEAIVQGQKKVYLNFFNNNNKTKDSEPSFINKNGAIWINNKKETEQPPVEVSNI